jgi:ubiquitin-activating enzyme E1
VDFVTVAASLRGRNFGIAPVDTFEARKVLAITNLCAVLVDCGFAQIAGRIVPAVATSTALVAGLVCLELTKIAARKPFTAFANSFANLATPMLSSTEPAPAPSFTVPSTGEVFTEWDVLNVRENCRHSCNCI